jgi:hypothetical protein
MDRPASTPIAAFVLAVVMAVVVGGAIASGNGGLSGLLTVGEEFPLRDYIRADLGDIQLASGVGHDGQQYYGIARDPFGLGQVPDLVDNPSYRYLHILYPALAGGLGVFPADVTVALMFALAVGGFGLAGGAGVTLARQMGGDHPLATLAIINVGLLLSVRFLTPDALALGLGMVGVVWVVAGRDRAAVLALAAAGLTKTTYLVIPLAVGAWLWRSDRGRAWLLGLAPIVPAALWTLYVFVRFGPSTAGNLSLPFTGVLDASGLWGSVSAGEVAMVVAAGGLLLAGAVLALTSPEPLLRWLLLAWVGVGVISSEFVWEFGNSTLRVLAPLWTLGVVAAAVYFSSSRSRKNLPV